MLGQKGTRKVTTTYEVNPKTGEVTEKVGTPEVKEATETVVTEELKPFEGGVNPVESVVTEELKPFEGGVNPVESVVTEELKPFEGGVNPVESVVTEELKPFEGGVNVEIPAVKEELSELKLALLKDEEGNILDVLAISEKPKKLNGYKYTGKEKEDSEGNKIYIYQKDNSGVVTSKSDEKVPTIELKPFEGGVNPEETVVEEELKPFEGGVNTETATVKEELPELKLALLKDEEGNILDVLAISEKPKELSGYKYTGKEKLDSEGNKIYIYQKVELENINNKKQDTIVVNQSQVLKENIESKTEITTDKNDKKIVDKKLPNTGETPLENGLLGGMLLAATMMLAKRKVKK